MRLDAASLDRLRDEGFVVVENALSKDRVAQLRRALDPHFEEQLYGRNPFEGHKTQRVYGLLQKTRDFDALIEDGRVMTACREYLGDYLLTAAHAILIHPGETAQSLHADDSFYPFPRPREPLGISTMWALDDFTDKNGATRLVAGSHRWGDERPGDDTRSAIACMPAGSLLIFLGTLFHGGGDNASESSRLGVTIQYCPGWARQQENYVLGVPAETARNLSPTVQALLGYSIHPPFMGHVNGLHPKKALEATATNPNDPHSVPKRPSTPG
jgi:ectoine hydroxylase-related dioxygenase (phytanoyl-CoA dioxygenase family)